MTFLFRSYFGSSILALTGFHRFLDFERPRQFAMQCMKAVKSKEMLHKDKIQLIDGKL